MLSSYIRGLKAEFRGYNTQSFAKDLMAGLTVTAVALPLALAFGVSSGADAAAGLITAILAGLIIGALSGGFYQISGPTGAMAAILMSVVARHSIQGVFAATLLAGVILLLAGLLRLGRLVSFIPAPVITGFTSGIAVIIALGQVDNFFGVRSEGSTAVSKLLSYGTLGFSPNWTAVAIGFGVVLFMVLFPKKWGRVIPASLAAIVAATAVSMALGLDVPQVGAIPQTLLPEARLSLSSLSPQALLSLLSPAFSIAMLGMIESLLCGASAGRMTGVRLNADQELIAQGIGNMVIPFFGGIPATAAIARTSVAIKSGARTRVAGMVHSVGLLLSMFLLAPVMSRIPLSALAGVLMVTAWRMNEWESIRYIFSHRFKGGILKFLATMLATIIFDLTVAIALGIFIALVLLLARLSQLEINVEDVDPVRASIDGDIALCRRYEKTRVVYISGPILFANCRSMENLPERIAGADTVLFSLRGVSHLDISGAQELLEQLKALRGGGVDVALCGVTPAAMEMMRRSGIVDLIGENNFYWSVDRVLHELRPLTCIN